MTWGRPVKQSTANRLLELQRGPAPFPGPRLTFRRTALMGAAHPSFKSAELGWFHFWPDLGSYALLPFPLEPAISAGGVAGQKGEQLRGRTP